MYVNIHGCGATNYGYPEAADVNNSNPLTGWGTAAVRPAAPPAQRAPGPVFDCSRKGR